MTTEGEAGEGVVRRRPRLDRLLETLGAAPVLEMLGVDAETLGRVQAGLEPLGERSWSCRGWGPLRWSGSSAVPPWCRSSCLLRDAGGVRWLIRASLRPGVPRGCPLGAPGGP